MIDYVTGGFLQEAGFQYAGSGPQPGGKPVELLVGVPNLGNEPQTMVGQRLTLLIPPAQPSVGPYPPEAVDKEMQQG